MVIAALLLGSLVMTEDSAAQSRLPKVGVLTIDKLSVWMQPFNRRLRELGWVEGKNLEIVYRNAGGDPSGFDAPLAELLQMKPDVLFPVGPPAVRAAFAAAGDIPIVAHDLETDPVAAGYARTYSRPGGNLTGLFLDSPDLSTELMELLNTLVPNLSRVAVFFDATSGPVRKAR